MLVARVKTLNRSLDEGMLADVYCAILPHVLYGEPEEWQSGQPSPQQWREAQRAL